MVSILDIHRSGYAGVLCVTGGGSLAISDLLTVPGASHSILEARVPYAWPALVDWLGAPPAHACSQHTARSMAMVSFWRAVRLGQEVGFQDDSAAAGSAPTEGHMASTEHGGEPPWERVWGVGCTASLATDRPKKGAHRFHIAWQTDSCTEAFSVVLNKGARSRSQEERLVADAVLVAVARACRHTDTELPRLAEGESFHVVKAIAEPAWRDVVLGRIEAARVVAPSSEPALATHPDATRTAQGRDNRAGPPPSQVAHPVKSTHETLAKPASRLIFPGAFHPLHDGHRAMAQWAEHHLGIPVEFEISVINVDKPPLDYVEIAERLSQFSPGQTVWLTRAATFVEKARIFPGSTFIVGADTVVRIGDPRYYGSMEACQQALDELAARGCRFLVFGRRMGDRFQTCEELDLPPTLRHLCLAVPAHEFHMDISSTQIRAQQHVMED